MLAIVNASLSALVVGSLLTTLHLVIEGDLANVGVALVALAASAGGLLLSPRR